MHTERKTKSAYFITRVDDAMFLVLLLEGTRRPNEKIAQVRLSVLLRPSGDHLIHERAYLGGGSSRTSC